MPLYESVFIARQDISAGQVDTLADDMEKLITDSGGSVARREYWGLRTLTYRMKKNRKGHFVMFNVEAPSDAILEMERNLRLHEDVLRYMTIRLDELRSEPSPMVHGKSDRDRADRRGPDDAPAQNDDADDSDDGETAAAAETPASEEAVVEAPAEQATEEEENKE